MPKTTIPEEFTIEDLTKDLQKIIDKNTVDSLITLLDIMLNHSELLSFHFIKSSMVVGINDFNGCRWNTCCSYCCLDIDIISWSFQRFIIP